MSIKKESIVNSNNNNLSSIELNNMFLKFLDNSSKALKKKRLNYNNSNKGLNRNNKFKQKKSFVKVFRNYKRFFPY
jgi:hypothetical protein